jgi:hypothetical protein
MQPVMSVVARVRTQTVARSGDRTRRVFNTLLQLSELVSNSFYLVLTALAYTHMHDSISERPLTVGQCGPLNHSLDCVCRYLAV